MMGKKTIAALATTAVIGGGSLGVAQLANADTTTPSPGSQTTQQASTSQTGKAGQQGVGSDQRGDHDGRGMGGHHGGMGMGDRGEDMVAALATKLGVSQDKVQSALESARDSLRPSANQGATGTQVDREAMRTQMEQKLAAALATKLGVSQEKVKTALDAIHAEREASMATQFKTYLDTQVKAGKITQADADAVLRAAKAGVIGYGQGGHR